MAESKRIRIKRGDLKLPPPKTYHYICEITRQSRALLGKPAPEGCAGDIRTRAIDMTHADAHLRSIGWHVIVHSRDREGNTITREVYCPQCKHVVEPAVDDIPWGEPADLLDTLPPRRTVPHREPDRDTMIVLLNAIYHDPRTTDAERQAMLNVDHDVQIMGVTVSAEDYRSMMLQVVGAATEHPPTS